MSRLASEQGLLLHAPGGAYHLTESKGIRRPMATDGHIKAAQARWELQLAILQEEERRVVDALEEHSRRGTALPQELLDRLKAARSQCNAAFQSLMACIERRAVGARC